MDQPQQRCLNSEDYSVVWFAPLPIEAKACFGVLDHIHEGHFEIHAGQDYAFSGGDLNGHNIIVATLPSGQSYGTVSAAALVNQVKLLFSAKLVFLVGVAAGVPRLDATETRENRDIRLGDVLVAIPDKTSAGVVAYDSGTCTTTDFAVTSRQAETSTLIRSVYSRLELHCPDGYAENGQFASYLVDAQKNLKRLFWREDFQCPDRSTDVLYVYTDGDDTTGTVYPRSPRNEPERPQVWLGKLGSGNTLMRNHKQRDRLRDMHDLIGLEMEAAGVMNFTQSAVIRGVCDYGDEKKNKKWQAYAAVVAAVYAKGVLMAINPVKLQTLPASSSLSMNHHGYGNAQIEIYQFREQRQAPKNVPTHSEDGRQILNWLSQHQFVDRYRRYLAKHQEGMVSWFFETDKYLDWKDGGRGVLLCKGIPGTGKSITMALTARELQRNAASDHTTSVIFFSRNEDKNVRVEELLAALAKQMLQKSVIISDVVLQIYQSYMDNPSKQVESKDILAILEHEVRNRTKVYFIVDALDELQRQVIIMLSTRDIEWVVELVIDKFFKTAQLEFCAATQDLQNYIDIQFNNRASLAEAKCHTTLVQEFKEWLIEKADGMFLLVVLCLRLLEAQSPKTKRAFSHAIAELRGIQSLYDVYVAMWTSIMDQDDSKVHLARDVFMWVSYSIELLTVQKLIHALAAQTSSGLDITNDDLLPRASITEPCLGLIVINHNDVVDFMHSTAREMFPDFLRAILESVEDRMCNACLNYLSQGSLGDCLTDEEIEDHTFSHPFLSYAAKAWAHHSISTSPAFKFNDLIAWLSQTESIDRAARIVSFLDPRHHHDMPDLPRNVPSQSLIAFFGLTDILRYILEWGLDPGPFRWASCVPFSLSAWESDLVTRAIRQGLDPNQQDSNGWTSIRWAAWSDQLDILEDLIGAGAMTDIPDQSGNTTLMWALDERPNQTLTQRRVASPTGDTVLHIGNSYRLPACVAYPNWIVPAPTRCSAQMLRMLISETRDINTTNKHGRTPLIQAAHNRQFQYIPSMLSQGADTELCDNDGMTALLCSVQTQDGDLAISDITVYATMKLHIGDQIIVDSEKEVSEVVQEYTETMTTIKRLCSRRIVEAKDRQGRTALAYAVDNGQSSLVDCLLRLGADVDSIDVNGMTPLLRACELPSPRLLHTGSINAYDNARVSQGLLFQLQDQDSVSLLQQILSKARLERRTLIRRILESKLLELGKGEECQDRAALALRAENTKYMRSSDQSTQSTSAAVYSKVSLPRKIPPIPDGISSAEDLDLAALRNFVREHYLNNTSAISHELRDLHVDEHSYGLIEVEDGVSWAGNMKLTQVDVGGIYWDELPKLPITHMHFGKAVLHDKASNVCGNIFGDRLNTLETMFLDDRLRWKYKE